MIEDARYMADGAVAARIDGMDWSGITPSHRFWSLVLEWEASGNIIAPYSPPTPVLPALSPRQLRLMLLQIDLTEQDIEAQITLIEDDQERAAAEIEWRWATQYERNHWLVVVLAGALEFEPAQLDALWLYATEL